MTTSLLDWLNTYAGALQAIATLALVAITATYVVLTARLSRAAADQAEATRHLVEVAREELRILADQWRGASFARTAAAAWEAQRIAKRLERVSPKDVQTFLETARLAMPTDDDIDRFLAAGRTALDWPPLRDFANALREAESFVEETRKPGAMIDAPEWHRLFAAIQSTCEAVADTATVVAGLLEREHESRMTNLIRSTPRLANRRGAA